MYNSRAVFLHQTAEVAGLYTSTLQQDFDLMRRAGLRNPIAYGEALTLADNGAAPRSFNYMAQLPEASSTLSAISQATTGIMRALGPKNKSLNLHAVCGDHAVRMAFNVDGRDVDITLLNKPMLKAGRMAQRATLGLCGIAINQEGFPFASGAYLEDQSLKCLTIRDDLSNEGRHSARRKAELLVKQPVFRDFKIVG